MASCQVCEKPLCAVCVYFDKGIAYCQEHRPAPGSGTVEFKAARQAGGEQPATPAAPNPPNEGGETVAIAPPIGGNPVLPPPQPAQQPVPLPLQPPPTWAPPTPTVMPPPPHWSQDPRLQPMPLEWRPGWPDEPLETPQFGYVDGRAKSGVDGRANGGLVLSGFALMFSFCCGVGAPIGLLLGLAGGGLSIWALTDAAKARNPQTARVMAGIGLGIAVLAVMLSSVVSFFLISSGLFNLF